MERQQRILVIGLGRLGDSLVRHLYDEGCEIIALDVNEENIEKAKNYSQLAVQCDSTDMSSLVEVGADKVDQAFICMGESFEASILTLTNLLDLKVPLITVRASTQRNAQVYKSVGAHKVFFVEEEMGRALASQIIRPTVLHEMDLDSNFKIIEWNPSKWALDKTLSELSLKEQYNIQLLALRDALKPSDIIFPEPQIKVKKGTTLIIMGAQRDLRKLFAQD